VKEFGDPLGDFIRQVLSDDWREHVGHRVAQKRGGIHQVIK
jgi:hypothetical protein